MLSDEYFQRLLERMKKIWKIIRTRSTSLNFTFVIQTNDDLCHTSLIFRSIITFICRVFEGQTKGQEEYCLLAEACHFSFWVEKLLWHLATSSISLQVKEFLAWKAMKQKKSSFFSKKVRLLLTVFLYLFECLVQFLISLSLLMSVYSFSLTLSLFVFAHALRLKNVIVYI